MTEKSYSSRKLLTVSQFAIKHPAFSESSLRWLRFNSQNNDMAPAFLKLGRRVYIDEEKFFQCLDSIQQK
jgi:hypothetical protein